MIPAPGIELGMIAGAQGNIAVAPDQTKQKPDLFLALCNCRAIRVLPSASARRNATSPWFDQE
jgi:hypothetical protein